MVELLLIIGIIILILINIIQYIKWLNFQKMKQSEYISILKKQMKAELEECKKELEDNKERLRLKHIREIEIYEKEKNELEKNKAELQNVSNQLSERLKDLDTHYEIISQEKQEKHKIKLEQNLEKENENYKQKLQQLVLEYSEKENKIKQNFIIKQNDIQKEIEFINKELQDYQQKIKSVNEAILRQREIEEKQDFYRICLQQKDKQDINFLLSIVDDLRNPQILYKLIWSEYIQKPFNIMLKNIFQNKECKCVIYKITNLKTGEIYIGKTKADVSKRWTEHIKTSLLIGTVSRSKLHDALYKHWDEFTFEVLEKVQNESLLSSREKYYINFYQSNIYGYNMNSGG